MIDSAAPCVSGARQIKLVKEAGRSPSWTGWASPMTPIQRRYAVSPARARVVGSVILALGLMWPWEDLSGSPYISILRRSLPFGELVGSHDLLDEPTPPLSVEPSV